MHKTSALLVLLLSASAAHAEGTRTPASALDILRQGGFSSSANDAGEPRQTFVIAPSPLERVPTDVDEKGYVSHIRVSRPKDETLRGPAETDCRGRLGQTSEERRQCDKDSRPSASQIAKRLGLKVNLRGIDAKSCPGAKGTSLCIGPKWKW